MFQDRELTLETIKTLLLKLDSIQDDTLATKYHNIAENILRISGASTALDSVAYSKFKEAFSKSDLKLFKVFEILTQDLIGTKFCLSHLESVKKVSG